jgi:hypothetical protein
MITPLLLLLLSCTYVRYSINSTAALFRKDGVRRRNCFLNTGSSMYAFNGIARKFLPYIYCPPDGTAKEGIT